METLFTFDRDLFSDLHKDAYGFRPRWDYFTWLENATDEELQQEWDSLLKAVERSIKEDELREKAAIEQFESLVAKSISSGAADRETALRWIMDASTCNGDWEFLCFEYGIPYGYFNKKIV